jgi:hypothetical protein
MAWGSYGAESTAPSIRQKANVSSGYVRLQVGQLFIAVIGNNLGQVGEE